MASSSLFASADADDPLAKQQKDAQAVSHRIDEDIQESRKAFERRKKAIKILLLGRVGKSTTLKNFQLAFSPQHFRSERAAWRTIIQLNLIRSIKRLLEVLQQELDESTQPLRTGAPDKGKGKAATVRFSTSPLTDQHRRMRMRLSPLLPIEEQLTRRLLPDANDRLQDVCVRAGSGWKGLLAGIQQDGGADGQARAKEPRRPSTAEGRRDDPTAVLAACRDDIIALWEDPVVRAVLKRRGVRLQDMPGFFLNDAARIATMGYDPTDEDIVRARLRTLGVEEHRFTMESGALPGSEWYIYDVGGSRNNRPMWIPYFDDIQAIIFLAPLAFNLMLEEDTKVNRLEDSIMLWKEICQNPLLAKTTLILFLNKATLAAGIRVNKYVPSYGDQPNDVQHVTKYFRDKFRGYHKRLSPQARSFYWHETSVVDTRSTAAILVGVREGILRAHLQSVNVI
ncbi:G-protein alpha subunit [Fomitopsis serialis]|uniref:G-protein alpha subunit n=1 Tax=Fomitopsis serialis TaxID=139415 RepID=UPI0020077E82|nr:G-protein alpha subunit [Neoantrodia serialis]KAH9916664.1 G-protein alpha subunit [Neoantrodia serialis]